MLKNIHISGAKIGQNGQKGPKVCLTCHFSLSHTYPYYVKWNYAIFYGLCGATTYPYLPYEIIDPLDPIGLPQGVTQFQLQYIKLTFFPPHRF